MTTQQTNEISRFDFDFSPTTPLTALTFRRSSSGKGRLVKRLTSVSALLVAGTLFGFVAHPLRPAAQEYGDSPKPSPVSRLHMTENISEEHLREKVEPEYPPAAKSTQVTGDVIFRITSGRDGVVNEIHLRRGNPMLIEAAAKALSKWRYGTIELDGTPVKVETFATVRFRLATTHP